MTEEGQRSVAAVRRRVKPGCDVAVETFANDPYGRYLAYVFYSSKPVAPTLQKLLEDGRFLNQELLDTGLAGTR